MDTFFKVVGVIVVGAVVLFGLLIVIGYFYVRRKMGQRGNPHTALMAAAEAVFETVPPFRIKLEPANHREWIDTDGFDAICEELDSRGGVRIGRFATSPPTVLLEAWHLADQNLFVVIYEHPVAGLWFEAGYEFEDGTLFACSTGPNHHMGNPPWTTFEFRTGVPTAELLDAVIADRPDKPSVATSAESFPSRFEEAWSRDMDWRIERGGPSEQEIRTTFGSGLAEESSSEEATSLAIETADDLEMVQQIRSIWRERINEFLETQLRESWIVSSGASALDWDRIRDRVIFIHDGLAADDLAEHLEQYLYANLTTAEEIEFENDEYERISEEVTEKLQTQSPRAIFSDAVVDQTSPRRHEKLGEIAEPVDADVWLTPQFEGGLDQ
jgi:hypothetical protein